MVGKNKEKKKKNTKNDDKVLEITDEYCVNLKINPYEVEINKAYTALCLLSSPEEEILILSLCTLNKLISKNENVALICLQKRYLLTKLLNIMHRSPMAVKQALRIIVKLMKMPGIISQLQADPTNVSPFIIAFMKNDDTIILEYCTYIFDYICESELCANEICLPEIIAKLFTSLVKILDMDVKRNCLKVLNRAVKCYPRRYFICQCESFNIKLLNYILTCKPLKILRPEVIDIMGTMSFWDCPEIHDKLHETNTVTHLFQILLETEWTDLQNRALDIIYNCVKYHPIQTQSLESKTFLAFVNFSRKGSAAHSLACLALIVEFAKQKENQQIMYDLGIVNILTDLCKLECHLTSVKFCEALTEFSQNCYVGKQLMNKKVFGKIASIMYKRYLPWNPYRQAGIQPLYLFSLINPKLGLDLFKTNILKFLREALLNRNQLQKLQYKLLMSLYHIISANKALHEYIFDEEVFEYMLEMCNDSSTDIVKIVLDIFICTISVKQYRDWFLKLGGVPLFIDMIAIRKCEIIDKLIVFTKLSSKYNDLAFAFLKGGLIKVLRMYGFNSIKQKAICDSVIEDIYKCELSIKFHDLNVLQVYDTIKNGFCLVIGHKFGVFPPDMNGKLSTVFTIIMVNFHRQKRDRIPINEQPNREGFNNIKINQKDDISIKEKTSVDSTLSKDKKVNCTLKIPLPEAEEFQDYYMLKYLKKLKRLFENVNLMTEKIDILAKFVCNIMGGHFNDIPKKHEYETHIMELKKKLQSNYIPLGFIRVGQKMERALLFKTLADRLYIPCILGRSDMYCGWNEVPVFQQDPMCNSKNENNSVEFYVVDLMNNIGALLRKGELKMELYCKSTLTKEDNKYSISESTSTTDSSEEIETFEVSSSQEYLSDF